MDATQNIPHIVITPERAATHNDRVRQIMPEATVLSADPAKSGTSAGSTKQASEASFWGSDGFTFADLLDIVNPLQHIPGVSTLYRAVTGDEIGVGPRIFGGAALGGVIGAGLAAANAAIQHETGKDAGQTVLAGIGNVSQKALQVAGLAAPTATVPQQVAAVAPAVTAPVTEVAATSLDPLPFSVTDALGKMDVARKEYTRAQAMDVVHQAALDIQS